MSIFDRLIGRAVETAESSLKGVARKAEYAASQKIKEGTNKAMNAALSKKQSFSFNKIPETIEEFKALPEASKLTDPFATAALTVLAYAAYTKNKEAGLAMFNVLRGPAPFTGLDIQRTDMSLIDEQDYIPFSYFEGATVENGYTPNVPYKVTIIQTSHSDDSFSEGYKRLFVKSSGADVERVIILRTKASTKEWFLSEHAGILVGVKVPNTKNPWA